MAHFVSSEERFLLLARDIAAGGEGAPEEFDFDRFNKEELERLAGFSKEELLSRLSEARGATLAWVRSLEENQLRQGGRHPVLGDVDLEMMITSIYGHQLLHMRDVMSAFGLKKGGSS